MLYWCYTGVYYTEGRSGGIYILLIELVYIRRRLGGVQFRWVMPRTILGSIGLISTDYKIGNVAHPGCLLQGLLFSVTFNNASLLSLIHI